MKLDKSAVEYKMHLAGFPVDDRAIIAFDITSEELLPYMSPEYHHVHWSIVLSEILEKRKVGSSIEEESKIEFRSVFLSYCGKESDLADIVDLKFSTLSNVKVSRFTRDVKYRKSFKTFMKKLSTNSAQAWK